MSESAGAGSGPSPGAERRGHRLLPHTADIRLEAWGPSPSVGLEAAVAALAESFVDVSNIGETMSLPIDLPRAEDREGMLVALLNEALFVIDVFGTAPVAAHLSVRGQGGLTGTFETVPVSESTKIGSAPKAVARSGLSFARDPEDGWRCVATIDV